MLEREYLVILQTFAYMLNIIKDTTKAKQFYNEVDKEALLKEINKHRKNLGDNKFFYDAGRTTEHLLNESQDNIESFNRMCGALYKFEKEIGLRD